MQNKVVIVAGAPSGTGRPTAMLLGARRVTVITTVSTRLKASEPNRKLRWRVVERLFQFERLDIHVNSAGVGWQGEAMMLLRRTLRIADEHGAFQNLSGPANSEMGIFELNV